MMVAEAPGEWEDKLGRPLWYQARAGAELEKLLMMNRLNRDLCYITNSVKCRPPKNRDPKPDETAACQPWLIEELRRCSPKIVVTIGRYATQFFLGDNITMEQVHGIPFRVTVPFLEGGPSQVPREFLVVPVFHPGAALRSPEMMLRCQHDFRAVSEILRGNISHSHIKDPYAGHELYNDLKSAAEVAERLEAATLVAIDTETLEDGSAWSVQFSVAPGTGYTVRVENKEALDYLRWFLSPANPNPPLTIIHNELFDRPVAEDLDFEFAKTTDTMVMAYLLQAEPQGLKPLAFRHAGMEMMSYEEMIAESGTQKAIDYLQEALKHEWPDPPQILEFKKDGTPHIKNPQNISKKIQRILKDYEKGKAIPWTRWHNIEIEAGRGMVEERLGRMPQGTIQDVWEQDPDRAIWYASRDPDATIRVYPYLWERIQALGLEETFWIDMGCIPMASDMQKAGILPDLAKFKDLSIRFGKKMVDLEAAICKVAGKPINPGSWQQIQWLLYTALGLKSPKAKKSTDDKTLARLKDQHKVVPMIREYRSYSKLKGTYADELPKKAADSSDGRIHTTIRLTRTSTGRICVDPNTLVEAPRDIDKYPKGIPLKDLSVGDWVYSFDHTRELCLKRVKWVGPTKKCPTIKLTYKALEDDHICELTCSPDHLLRMYKGHWKHAEDIHPGERLLCMVRRHNHGQGYFSFYPHSKNRRNGKLGGGKVKEHRFIAQHVYNAGNKLGAKTIVHHLDGNPHNNNPSNLQILIDRAEHQRMHAYTLEDYKEVLRTKQGKRGQPLKYSTIQVYKRRMKRMELGIIGRNHVVLSVERGPEMQLWDLEVEDTHCFIGNEAALHNSSANPNLMNQPTRTEDGKEIKKAFIAPPGCIFGSADYSGIEMRVAAHVSQDPFMLKIFRNGEDLHSQTASNVFGIPVSQVDKMKHRYPCKRVGFGILYGITASGLREQLLIAGLDPMEWTIKRTQELINEWFQVYKGVEKFMYETELFARRNGYVRDMWGRIRYVPGVRAADEKIQAEAVRQAGNQPIQSGAQGIIKKAMGKLTPVYKQFQREGNHIIPIIQIHDDLLFEMSESFAPIWMPIQKSIMEGVVNLSVPVVVDAETGYRWGEMEGLKEWTI